MRGDKNRYMRLASNLSRRYPATYVQNYESSYSDPLMGPSRRYLTSCIYFTVSVFLSAGLQSPAFAQHFLIRTLLAIAGFVVAFVTYGTVAETAMKLQVVACYLTIKNLKLYTNQNKSEAVMQSIEHALEREQFQLAGADLDHVFEQNLHTSSRA
jgi:hypothetical protein